MAKLEHIGQCLKKPLVVASYIVCVPSEQGNTFANINMGYLEYFSCTICEAHGVKMGKGFFGGVQCSPNHLQVC